MHTDKLESLTQLHKLATESVRKIDSYSLPDDVREDLQYRASQEAFQQVNYRLGVLHDSHIAPDGKITGTGFDVPVTPEARERWLSEFQPGLDSCLSGIYEAAEEASL